MNNQRCAAILHAECSTVLFNSITIRVTTNNDLVSLTIRFGIRKSNTVLLLLHSRLSLFFSPFLGSYHCYFQVCTYFQGCTYTTICLYCRYTKILAIRSAVQIPMSIGAYTYTSIGTTLVISSFNSLSSVPPPLLTPPLSNYLRPFLKPFPGLPVHSNPIFHTPRCASIPHSLTPRCASIPHSLTPRCASIVAPFCTSFLTSSIFLQVKRPCVYQHKNVKC